MVGVVADDGADHRLAVDVGLHACTWRSFSRPQGISGTGRYSSAKISHICAGADLAALGVGHPLDHLGELDLQPARQLELVLGAHDVGHAALAGLGVDPDDGLVGAADVLRVDRQVGDLPAEVVDRRRRPCRRRWPSP